MLQSLLVLVTDYFSYLKIRLLVEGRAGEGKRSEGKGRGGDDVWDENGLCAFVVFFVCVYVCVHVTSSSVLHLLEELVGWVLVAVLLHL